MAAPRRINMISYSILCRSSLENRKLQTISVSEIAQTAGIGKGSIYYYFPSKDAILEALVERNYEKPLTTAKTPVVPDGHSAVHAHGHDLPGLPQCLYRISEVRGGKAGWALRRKALLHQKYMSHLISEFKPVLAEIIQQGIDAGEIHFDRPEVLAEIVLNRADRENG